MTNMYDAYMIHVKNTVVDEVFVKNSGFLLAMLGLESRRMFTTGVAQIGVSWQGQKVITALHTLAPHQTVSQKQLADFVNVDPRNLVAVIDTLEQYGMLQRATNPIDRRGYQIQLTPQGDAVATQIQAIRSHLEDTMLAPLMPSERRVLHTLLMKLWKSSEVAQGFHIPSAADDKNKPQ